MIWKPLEQPSLRGRSRTLSQPQARNNSSKTSDSQEGRGFLLYPQNLGVQDMTKQCLVTGFYFLFSMRTTPAESGKDCMFLQLHHDNWLLQPCNSHQLMYQCIVTLAHHWQCNLSADLVFPQPPPPTVIPKTKCFSIRSDLKRYKREWHNTDIF